MVVDVISQYGAQRSCKGWRYDYTNPRNVYDKTSVLGAVDHGSKTAETGVVLEAPTRSAHPILISLRSNAQSGGSTVFFVAWRIFEIQNQVKLPNFGSSHII